MSTMNEVYLHTRAILARQLDNVREEELLLETGFADVQADSIDILELIMAIEDIYEVEFPESELENYPVIEDLVKALYNYLKSVGK